MALMLFSGTTFDSPRKADGTVNAGGKVWFYEPGTTTAKNAYTTSALTTATTNPLVLDSKGCGTAWLNGSYYIRVTDKDDVLIDDEDNYNKGSSFDITAVTAARTMVGVDDTGSFTHSGTYTVSLTQASTLGAGWFTDHYNIGTGVITFARLAAGDTIDGTAANFTLQPGEFVRITVNSGTTGFVTALHKQNLYATAAGTDTYTCTFAPAISALYDGQKMRVRFTNANTVAAPTLNANGLGAKTIKKEGSAALVAGDIPAGHEAELTYNGTDYILGNPKYFTGISAGGVVPLARMQRTFVATSNGAAVSIDTVGVQIASIDCGTVAVGDKVLISFNVDLAKDATAANAEVGVSNGGTCTIELPAFPIKHYCQASLTRTFATGWTGNIAAAGTLVLKLNGKCASGAATVSKNLGQVNALVLVGS